MGSVGIEKLHVLAVDDSLVDRKVIERLLTISCCKVTAVDSGIRALEFLGLDGDENKMELEFQELKVNLIITDYSMPGMTGFELLKKIKGSSACKEIPVVIMSSENIMTRIDRCLEEGAEDFLMKPVKLSDVERLRDVLINDTTKVSKMQSEQISSDSEKTELMLNSIPSTAESPAEAAGVESSDNDGMTTVVNVTPALPSLFNSSDLSCSLQHLSSPPSSPHWPSKRPRLLNGEK